MTAPLAATGPHIDWAGLSPIVALLGGAILALVTVWRAHRELG